MPQMLNLTKENLTHVLKSVFIGFSPGQKAHKLYSLDSKQVIVSRDVIFYEDIFPFQVDRISDPSTNVPLPLDHDMDSVPNNVEDTEEEILDTSNNSDLIEDSSITASHRRSTRQKKMTNWLNDYVLNTVVTEDTSENHDSPDTQRKLTSYTRQTFPYNVSKSLNRAYVNFLTNIFAVKEPHTYDQAKRCDEWIQVMQQEIIRH